MTQKWQERPLAEVVSLHRGYDLPTHDRSHGTVPVMGSFGVTGWHNIAKVPGPGVTVGRSGASYGVVARTTQDYWPLNTCLYVEDFHGNDPNWVYFLLSQLDFKTYNSGSAQPSLNRNYIKHIRLRVPPLEEQKRIAGVLGVFDDLIEANRLLSRDLLSLLFAKYEVLAEGQPLTSFGSVAHLVRDQWKPGSEGPSRYLGLEHFATEGAGLTGAGDAASVQSVSLRFRPGDVLYGKLRPYFRKVARPRFAGLCSSEIWVLRARHDYPQSLVHALTHAASFSEAASAGSTGTRMPRADWNHISTLPVPDLRLSEVSAEVLARLESLWSAACDLDEENYELIRQRDELLPLLMSGRVRVRDLEAVV